MEIYTRAAQTLRTRLAERGIGLRELALQLGVTHQSVMRWLSGRAIPRAEHVMVLRDRYDIPAEAWYELPRGRKAAQ